MCELAQGRDVMWHKGYALTSSCAVGWNESVHFHGLSKWLRFKRIFSLNEIRFKRIFSDTVANTVYEKSGFRREILVLPISLLNRSHYGSKNSGSCGCIKMFSLPAWSTMLHLISCIYEHAGAFRTTSITIRWPIANMPERIHFLFVCMFQE